MRKNIIYLSVIVLLFIACNGIQVTEKLNQIDSLVAKEQYDSADSILKNLANVSMTADDQAHYYLLATQLGYLTNQPLSSDSLLDLAIIYYNKVKNKQKLANCYFYKSYRSEINKDYPQAILYIKDAERLEKAQTICVCNLRLLKVWLISMVYVGMIFYSYNMPKKLYFSSRNKEQKLDSLYSITKSVLLFQILINMTAHCIM